MRRALSPTRAREAGGPASCTRSICHPAPLRTVDVAGFALRRGVDLDIDNDLGGLAGRGVEFPDAKVVLVDDGLAVGGDAGEEEVAIAVMRDLRFLAALFGDLPDVVDALHDVGAAELDALFSGG